MAEETTRLPADKKRTVNKIAAHSIVVKPSDVRKASTMSKVRSAVGDTDVSDQIPDPYENMDEQQGVLNPPYDLATLAQLPENNNILQQCIDAYCTNIVGFGYGFRYTIDMESPDIQESIKKKAKDEMLILEAFYKYCSFDEPFTEIMKKVIDGRERVGFGAIEVIPKANGMPGSFEWVPSHTLRLSKLDPTPVLLDARVVTPDGKEITVKYQKRFRKICQILESENKKIWFKEFGDPRDMDKETGEIYDPNNKENPGKPISDPTKLANSIILFPIHAPYTPYGIPRYMGNTLSIHGSRKSEELNYNYFVKGKHIPLAIIVKNGSLTTSSVDKLKEYATQVMGVENAHGYLVLEAAGFEDDENFGESNPQGTDIKIEHLTEAMQQDALFQDYDKNNRDKIRSCFRLPPIYTGESTDYNRATADTARAIAEEQVFAPEREALAFRINNLVNKALGIKYAELYFKGPNLSNHETKAKALESYIKAGAVTPNMLIHLLSELLNKKLEPIQEDWGNKPIQITLAEMGKKIDQTGRVSDDGTGMSQNEPNPDESVNNTEEGEDKTPVEGEVT